MLKARGHFIAYFLPRQEKKMLSLTIYMMPNLFNYKTGISTKCQLWFVPILYLVPTPKFIQCLFSSLKYWLDRRCGKSSIDLIGAVVNRPSRDVTTFTVLQTRSFSLLNASKDISRPMLENKLSYLNIHVVLLNISNIL